jgi:ATP-binding cassette subfamily F protein 3
MILLTADGLTKHFGPEPVLDELSLEIRAGQKVGLVGPNGVGKTTLMRILCGLDEPDGGRVDRASGIRVGYLEQHPQFEPGRTVRDEAALGLADLIALAQGAEAAAAELSRATDPAERRRLAERYERLQHSAQQHRAYELDHRIEQVMSGLGFDEASLDRPVEQLSGGQQNRLILGRLLLAEPDLLLLDEPSNHLDIEATRWLEDYLSQLNAAMLIVSHDRYLLDRVTNRTFELFAGTVDAYSGNFSAYWHQKAERLKVQQRTFEKQQELIAKTQDFIRRNMAGQKSAQAKDREKKLARIERVEVPREIVAPPMGFPKVDRAGDIALRIEKLAKSFDRPLFGNLTFDIGRGERWGVLGPNGCGKTTLLRCLVGETPPDAGRVIWGHGVRVGYFDQSLNSVDSQVQVVDAIRPPHREFHEPQRRDLLARFGIRGDMVFQPVSSLSGGERNRVALARLAALEANVLVLDEPTNHLDLWARDALERTLVDFGGTVLFVSHDRFFLNQVADHLLIMEEDRFRVIEGNYDHYQYLAQSRRDEQLETASRSTPVASKPNPAVKPKRRFPYRKVEDLEQEIFTLEQRAEELQAQLSDPEILRSGERVRQTQTTLTEVRAQLATLYEHWEEAARLN